MNNFNNGDKNNIEKAAVRAAAGEIRTNIVQSNVTNIECFCD